MTALALEELADLRATVAGALTAAWDTPQSAGHPDAGDARLGAAWDVAVRQGWTELGGEGALDALVAVTGELGRLACPLPLADVYVATRLLGGDLAAAVADGRIRPVVAAAEAARDGVVGFVEAAAAATHLLLVPAGDGEATLAPIAGVRPTPGTPVPAWSEVSWSADGAVTVPVTGAAAEEARAVLRLALAARAYGAAGRSAQLALEHANLRHQFGRPIGSFQAVSHRCVDGAIDVAAFTALAGEAVRLGLAGDRAWLLAAELAVAHAAATAPRVQFGAHHTLAAVGYFEEHEAPWLFRRVHADVARLRELPPAGGEPGDVLVEGGAGLPPLDLGERAEAARAEVRAFIAERVPGGPTGEDPVLLDLLAAAGYLAPGLPREYGGRGADPAEQVAIGEELTYAGLARQARVAAGMLGPSIAAHGTPEQKSRFLPLISRGRMPFYLGYSEPETGSDLAHLRTTARRDGEDWVVTGQKMWGTGAHTAEWIWLAARTDPEARAHAGITVFCFPVGLPGWSIQQHRSLGGEISCTSFFDDVRVPDSARIGEPGGGWRVLTEALAHERIHIASGTARLLRLFDDLLGVLRADPAAAGMRGSAARATLTGLAVRLQAARALVASSTRAALQAGSDPAAAAMAKIIGSELEEDLGEAVLQLLGPAAALADGPNAGAPQTFEESLRLSIMMVVSGGTNDIQRNLVARALGLPR
ncbi:acyl-CoA dehydrogenase family protein [Geodermatophilus ruber]|uniref:Acyl-CoA dehydrogenase n=1 Tax=Geodermatophilus ruber TaxID=504800 RepID=A0A1I4GWB7_9ACTN|nr:acyl-CoA dehydrogenase family protein [Geodermatophilus ruber]SFL33840.1 Acyl-CoA dehydrogenase [Geodermatophilus ruber]